MIARKTIFARIALGAMVALAWSGGLAADAGHGDAPAPEKKGPLQKVVDIFTRQSVAPTGPEIGIVLERPGIKEPGRSFRIMLIVTPARLVAGASEEFVFQIDERLPTGELVPMDGYVPKVTLALGTEAEGASTSGDAAPVKGEPGRYRIRLALAKVGAGTISLRVGSEDRGLLEATFPLAVAGHLPPLGPWVVLALLAGGVAFSLARRRSPSLPRAAMVGGMVLVAALTPYWVLSGRGRASLAARAVLVAEATLADDLAPHEPAPEPLGDQTRRADAGDLATRAFGMVSLRDGARGVISAPQSGVLTGLEIVPRGTSVQAGEVMARLRILNLELAPDAANALAQAAAASAALEMVEAQWERAEGILAGAAASSGAASEVDLASGRLAFARRQRDRAQRLLEKKVISAREAEEAALELAEAEIGLERAVNTLKVELVAARAEAAATRQAADAFGEAGSAGAYLIVEIPAPFGGIVTAVSALPGAFVEEGEVLYELIQPGALWLDARLYEHQVAMVAAGATLTFRVSTSETLYRAVLESLGREMDANSTLPTILTILNPDDGLIAGQQAVITIGG
ncbi:HlyD family secretion protein [bacterium]|nr:HlyD family secretion protein [bacterium]